MSLSHLTEKYIEFENAKAQQAAIKYIEWVMKEENISFAEAKLLCETVPKYSLGLKLSAPAVQQAINKGSYKKRMANRQKIAADLPDEERILFLEIPDTKNEFKEQMKKQKRERKKGKRNE